MTGNVLGERYLKKNITIALSSSQIFLNLYGIPLLSQKKCIILFSVNEKKEKERWVSPGSSHFESSKSSKAIQQDTRNPLRFSAWRTKLKKKDQWAWINHYFSLRVKSNHNRCS